MKKYLFLIAVVLFAFAGKAQGLAADSIDVFIATQMQQQQIPGLQLAVIRHGQIIKLKNYGLANVEHHIPVSDQSVFFINSITKAFVGVAVMQLVEQGKLDLSAPLSRYLDSLPAAWQPIRIRQLLSHNSGIPEITDINDNPRGDGSYQSAMKATQALPMDFATGERFSYNQTNYVLIGKIIEKLAGVKFNQFIQERQLDVVGMKRTGYADGSDIIPGGAGNYTNVKYINGKWTRINPIGIGYKEFPDYYRTAAGMISTAQDMANWLIDLQGGKLLKEKSSLDTLWKPSLLNNGKPAGFSKMINGYAIGWPVILRAEHPAIAPMGGGRSVLFVYPKDDLSIILLTNLQGCNPESIIDEIAAFYLPDMKVSSGFGLTPDLRAFRNQLVKVGFQHTLQEYSKARKRNPKLVFNEEEVNSWAYTLLRNKQVKEAIEIFKLNVYLFPKSWNTYDSLGEAYEADASPKLAIVNYRLSFGLNPQNTNAQERIKLLQAQQVK